MSSIVAQEIENFSKDSAHWWDENGPFKPLHALNPVRLSYIKAQICSHYDRDTQSLKPFEKLSMIDVGCGGGLVCEPLSRLGAKVTGADADANAIAVASAHAKAGGLKIDYFHGPAENLINASSPPSSSSSPPSSSSSLRSSSSSLRKQGSKTPHPDSGFRRNDESKYDVVLALEIIEHVAEPAEFVKSVAKLCKPGGLIIFSTLNRTPQSFALGIVAAEYILRWVPAGTHSWKKFIRPSELSRMARGADLKPTDVSGLVFNPIKNEFALSEKDISVNYLLSCTKS